MKCPKCGNEVEENVRTCNSCGFSITEDGKSLGGPILEQPVVPGTYTQPVKPKEPEPSHVLEENVTSAPEVKEEVEETSNLIVPPVVDDKPSLEETKEEPINLPVEPVLTEEKTEEIVTENVKQVEAINPSALEFPESPIDVAVKNESEEAKEAVEPVAPAPAPAPVPSVQAAPAEASSTVEEAKVTNDDAVVSAPASQPGMVTISKRSLIVYIVIGILSICVVVLLVLVINDKNSDVPLEAGSTGTLDVNDSPSGKEEEEPDPNQNGGEALDGPITFYGIKFSLPQGFQYIFKDDYYQVFNKELRKVFIVENLYSGARDDLETGINLIKAEYPTTGCTDVTGVVTEKSGVAYGLVTYMYNGTKLEEVYTLVDNKYILAFYNIETNLVSTDEFINYAIEITKTGDDSAATFSSATPDELEFGRKYLEQNIIVD